jgi:hypothetical protein
MLYKWRMFCFIRKLSFQQDFKVGTFSRWHSIGHVFVHNELYPESLPLYKLKITLLWQIKIDKFMHFEEISWVKWSLTYQKWLMKCYNDLWCVAENFHNTVIYLSFSITCWFIYWVIVTLNILSAALFLLLFFSSQILILMH